MKKIILSSLLIGASIALTAQSKQTTRLEEARKAIEASNEIYSDLANKNDGSILSRYTKDACLLPPNSPALCGSEAIIKFFKDGPKLHAKFKIIDLYGDGIEYVTEQSSYELFDMDWKKFDEGRITVVWKNTKEGWKMYRDMFSSSLPQKK